MLFKKKEVKEVKQKKDNLDKGILVLGSGCKKCEKLESNLREAMDKLGLDEEIIHVKDYADIASFGVMTTPALVIDNQVLSYGKILSVEEAEEFVRKFRG